MNRARETYTLAASMVALLILFILFSLFSAKADEAKPAEKPVCGKTVAECQVKVDADEQTIKELTAGYQGARQQRDVAQQANSDTQLQNFVMQQAPKPKP